MFRTPSQYQMLKVSLGHWPLNWPTLVCKIASSSSRWKRGDKLMKKSALIITMMAKTRSS